MDNVLPLSECEFKLFREFLEKETGLCFDKDKKDFLRFALWERLKKWEFDSFQEYYNFLKFHYDGHRELRELLILITIGETRFFRNGPQFDALITSVLPEIIKRKTYSADKSIRVWSVGCSRGDEPYSIAIAIMETISEHGNWDISILGTDINDHALNCARKAVYNKRDTEDIPEAYLNKYFEKAGASYLLNERVKSLVKFKYHNLIKEDYATEEMQNLDLLFCRNVTIYFNFQTTKRIIEKFYDNLNNEGYLFVGHVESLWGVTDKFKQVELPQSFIYKKNVHTFSEEPPKPFIEIPEIKYENIVSVGEMIPENATIAEAHYGKKEQKSLTGEADTAAENENLKPVHEEVMRLFGKKEYEKAIVLFDKIIEQDNSCVSAYFGKASILANQGKYQEAMGILLDVVKMKPLNIEVNYLLGVLFYKTGAYKEAEDQFRKVIYLDPEIVIAYYNLGSIYLYQKKFTKALREFNNAISLLEKRPKDECIMLCADFTVEFLTKACKKNLENINCIS